MKVLSHKKNALPLQQHTYPASRKNSALRVSFLFLYAYDNEQDVRCRSSSSSEKVNSIIKCTFPSYSVPGNTSSPQFMEKQQLVKPLNIYIVYRNRHPNNIQDENRLHSVSKLLTNQGDCADIYTTSEDIS